MSKILEGVVYKSTGSWYDVQTEAGNIRATLRGKLRLSERYATNPVAVGDSVHLMIGKDGFGVITDILPRKNELCRRATGSRSHLAHIIVANVDFAWCVQSVKNPKFTAGFIDRFLVMTELYDIPAGILINKADLLSPAKATIFEAWQTLYESLGYPVIFTSTLNEQGIDNLRESLKNKNTVFSGPSGVGKTSLLNTLSPSLSLETGEISSSTNKGTHTTTFASIFPLPQGGLVIDTPGLREFGIYDIIPEDLDGYFVEFLPLLNDCKYPNCTHEHEPQCAIMEAVGNEIHPSRYKSYLNILNSL